MLGEEVAWYQQLGRSAAEVQHKISSSVTKSTPVQMMKACVRPESPDKENRGNNLWDVPAQPRQWNAFEFADLLEGGISPGISAHHIVPPKLGTEVRLRVLRAQDRKSFVLSEERGSTRLVARCEKQCGGRFEIFVAIDGDPPRALGPAFILTADDPVFQNWTLQSARCEECEARGKRNCGVRELARITHYSEPLGGGKAFCMDVEIPAVKDGRADTWCTLCSEPSVQDRFVELTSIRPKWNARRKDLQLNFKGRCKHTSAKNFQLESRDLPGQTTLLFGKCAEHEFVLDYFAPLSEVQAFAAALTTTHWV
jgi:hypothetical protein